MSRVGFAQHFRRVSSRFASSTAFQSCIKTRKVAAIATLATVTTGALSTTACVADGSSTASKVYTWGFNRYGQLGIGGEENECSPHLVESLSALPEAVSQISCGMEQTAVLTHSGSLFTFGRGQDSRLGHGSSGGVNETTPRLVEELAGKRVLAIDSGFMHMACVTSEDGAVYTWGKNTYHQLGHDGSGLYPQPVAALLEQGVDCRKVSCGRYHCVALTTDGRCYAWGGYKSGETGTGSKKTCATPSPVVALPNASEDPVVDVCCGQAFSLFLTKSGDVYSCGSNDQGQGGHGSTRQRYQLTATKIGTLSNIEFISAGHFHALACDSEGRVFSWGNNHEGQLGHGDTQNRTTPALVSSLAREWRAISVAAGGGHSAVLCTDRESQKERALFVFGRGRQGQIGRGDHLESVAAYRSAPVKVDFFDAVADAQMEQVALGGSHSAVLCQ